MLCLTEALEVKLVDSRIRNRIKKFYAYVAITSVSVEQGQLNCCIQAYVNIDAEQLLPTTPSLEKVLLSTLIFSLLPLYGSNSSPTHEDEGVSFPDNGHQLFRDVIVKRSSVIVAEQLFKSVAFVESHH